MVFEPGHRLAEDSATVFWSGGKKISQGIFNLNGYGCMICHFYITICNSFPLCIKLQENQIRKSPCACRWVRTADSAILKLLIKLHLYCWGAINVESIQYLEMYQGGNGALRNTEGHRGRPTSQWHSFACQKDQHTTLCLNIHTCWLTGVTVINWFH